MSIESEIRELERGQRKYSRYSTEWRKIENKKDELKRKRKRDADKKEDDNGDIATLAAAGILDSLGDSDKSYSDSSSSIDFGGGDSGGGFGGDF